VRLLVLGVVILAVLLQVAPFARDFDSLGDLAATLAFEVGEFGLQRLQALGGGHVGGVGHDRTG
jgi:hypothetical protein